MITEHQRDQLRDILTNTEALEKITVALDPTTHTMTVTYDDLDDEWFHELWMAHEIGAMP